MAWVNTCKSVCACRPQWYLEHQDELLEEHYPWTPFIKHCAYGGLGNSQRILVGGEQDTSCVLAHHVGLLQLCGSYASTTSAPPQAY
eukprot:1158369-Pelagomonas_calceolata.AAC.7